MPYAYEADIHCASCFEKRFSADVGDLTYEDLESLRDSEGNTPAEYYDSDAREAATEHEWTDGPFVEVCGTCGALLYARAEPDDYLQSEPPRIPWREWSNWRIAEARAEVEELDQRARDAEALHGTLTATLADYARGLAEWDDVRRAAGEDEYHRGALSLAA